MATMNINAYSSAFPFVLGDIRASIAKESSPLAIVDFIIDSTLGHPSRIYTFAGIARDNYRFSLDELDGVGIPIRNLAVFSVVPGDSDGLVYRIDEQIQVGVTKGFNAGESEFTFDGSADKPDYLGWDIVPYELSGRGVLVKGVDYSWDMTTGKFSLLQVGDIFQEDQWYNIRFHPQTIAASEPSPPQASVTDFVIERITDDYNIAPLDFGKMIIAESLKELITIELPVISSVPTGRKIMLENVRQSPVKCVMIQYSEPIEFLTGKIYLNPGEGVSIYSDGTKYRVAEIYGNHFSVGEIKYYSLNQASSNDRVLLDGRLLNIRSHRRLYDMVLQNLPLNMLVPIDDWSRSKTKFSNTNGNGEFRIPDLRGLYMRSADEEINAFQYLPNAIKVHGHIVPATGNGYFGKDATNKINIGDHGSGRTRMADWTSNPINNLGQEVGDTETRPETVKLNLFITI